MAAAPSPIPCTCTRDWINTRVSLGRFSSQPRHALPPPVRACPLHPQNPSPHCHLGPDHRRPLRAVLPSSKLAAYVRLNECRRMQLCLRLTRSLFFLRRDARSFQPSRLQPPPLPPHPPPSTHLNADNGSPAPSRSDPCSCTSHARLDSSRVSLGLRTASAATRCLLPASALPCCTALEPRELPPPPSSTSASLPSLARETVARAYFASCCTALEQACRVCATE